MVFLALARWEGRLDLNGAISFFTNTDDDYNFAFGLSFRASSLIALTFFLSSYLAFSWFLFLMPTFWYSDKSSNPLIQFSFAFILNCTSSILSRYSISSVAVETSWSHEYFLPFYNLFSCSCSCSSTVLYLRTTISFFYYFH